MSTRFLARLGVSQSPFVEAARQRGLRSSVAQALESAAHELHPEDPLSVLDSHPRFEAVAMHAVVGDAGNLELSFGLVDALASAMETLKLARITDVPEPFRRVRIDTAEGDHHRGVVLRCERGEVAVFCSPKEDWALEPGESLRFSYLGYLSSVAYSLRVNDVVRLPGALVLHLNRPEREGSIGRDARRYDVRLAARVRVLGDHGDPSWSHFQACEILDVSFQGMRIASTLPFGPNHAVEVELAINDGDPDPVTLPGILCWNREDPKNGRSQGLELKGILPHHNTRYRRFIRSVASEV